MIVAYITLGTLAGPYGFGVVNDIALLEDMSHLGIILLLFLLGLDMQPSSLKAVFQKATFITFTSTLLLFVLGFVSGKLFGFTSMECVIIGTCIVFSSTIIGIKLLPTTVLHHRPMGELMIGLLLMQDFIAILVLLIIIGVGIESFSLLKLARVLLALPLIILFCHLAVRFLLFPIISRFDRISEFIFLLSLGWCFGIAKLSASIGLSEEIGAFIAGVTIATHPVSQYIAHKLKPLRDFFLVIFFFAIGARFNFGLIGEVILPIIVITLIVVILKPIIFRFLVRRQSDNNNQAWDLGFRLGQLSEFSLLIVALASSSKLIGEPVVLLIQAATILTLVISSYIIVFNYPNPMAVSDKLRRD